MKLSQIPYERVTLEQYRDIINSLLEKFDKCTSAGEQKQVYFDFVKQTKHYSTMRALLGIRCSQNSTDEFYSKEREYYIGASGEFRKLNESLTEKLVNSKYLPELKQIMPSLIFDKLEATAKTFSPEIADLLVQEGKLCQEYSKLMSTAKIEFYNNIYNLSQMGQFCESPDREIRKQAYCAQGRWMKSTNAEDIFDKLVKVRDSIAKKLGFKNYVEVGYLSMHRIGYGKDQVASFRKQVKDDLLPVVMKLKEKQARDIGVDKITLIDNTTKFKQGSPKPIGDANYLFEKGKEMYESMSKETAEFINFMLDNDCFDVLSRENKSPGGYCSSLPEYKMPFIFANFNGTSMDVDILFHEAGHAFFDYMNRDVEYPEIQNTFMETSETHAKSMEFFAHKYSKMFFGERAEDYMYAHISKGLDFIPYAVIVDYFQQCVYENADMTKKQRNDLWNSLVEEYAPYLSAEGIDYYSQGARWQFQLHIFSAPFYYIDYALSQAVALQFYAEISKDYEKAWEKYIQYIRKSAFVTFEQSVKDIELISPFEDGALKGIANKIL